MKHGKDGDRPDGAMGCLTKSSRPDQALFS